MNEQPPPELKVRKRKRRVVLSCNDCRRRKLKCNREFPCNRCINGGIANACAYGHEDELTIAADAKFDSEEEAFEKGQVLSAQPSTSENNRITDSLARSPLPSVTIEGDESDQQYIAPLQRRVALLEAQLSSIPVTAGNLELLRKTQDRDIRREENVSPLTGLFKGEGYRTFAYGSTSPITIVVHFPQLRPFMKSVYPDSNLGRIQDEVKALEDRARSNKVSNRVLSVPYLRSILPERATVDVLIKQYLETFETTYRILHIPSFLAEYETFWDAQPGSNSGLEALVLAILACVLCTSTHQTTRHNPNGSTFRSKAILWVKACEAWLKRQSNKNRTIASLQVRCLRILALKSTCMKTKEIYQEVQSHFAFMRSIGMHRDPSIMKGRCSIFDGEIRRRLWATTLELELQASVDKGTPSVLSSLEYDCSPPRNINDSELQVDIKQLPPSHPISVFTDTSFLHCLMQTAVLRTTLCSATNRLKSGPSPAEISQYEEEIQGALEQLPKWSDPKSFQAWTHLDLVLRQFLVILHTQRTLQTQLRTRTYHRYSMLTCLEAAVTLIDRHIDLIDSGNFVLCCIRSDYYRAALILCHIAYHASNDADTLTLRVVQPLFDGAIEKALRLQEERALRPGRGNKQFWYISAACSLVRLKFQPEREEALKRQAVDRVSRILYKILSLQDDPSAEYLADEVMLGDGSSPAETRTVANAAVAPVLPSTAYPSTGLNFDLSHTSEWMLDDFWFFNDVQPFPPLDFGT